MPEKMLCKALNDLKDKRGLTIQELADLSQVPEGTVKKILSGSTENPTFRNVCQIVIALGGSVDEMVGIKPVEKEDTVYISQELISSYKKHIEDKSRWMRIFFTALCVVMSFIMIVLLFDLLNGNVGYVRY